MDGPGRGRSRGLEKRGLRGAKSDRFVFDNLPGKSNL